MKDKSTHRWKCRCSAVLITVVNTCDAEVVDVVSHDQSSNHRLQQDQTRLTADQCEQ